MSLSARNKYARRTREAAIFGMFGAMMFATKYLMEILPNIHLLAMFIGILTDRKSTRLNSSHAT